jgi:hypothetical protein
MESKRVLTAKAIEEQQLVIASHAPFPGIGRLSEEGGKRRWTPVEASP